MKILFLATRKPDKQGDYMELTLIHGFRELMGNDFVEYPKKKILYGDFSETPKNTLHGMGFSLCSTPITDIIYDRNNIKMKDFDVVIHGSGFIYGDFWQVEHPNQFWTDGNDLYGDAPRKINFNNENVIGTQYLSKCFKRELVEYIPSVWPTGFGIPRDKITNNTMEKKLLFQSTAPSDACFQENSAYIFDNEKDYYTNMQQSWFGLTCKKGGWDCLRHYEILASGALLLFRDYDKKPSQCSPIDLPTLAYSSQEQLNNIMNILLVDNKPTPHYIELHKQQHKWLLDNGTTYARAAHMLQTIQNYDK
jgi:hypothetical protein